MKLAFLRKYKFIMNVFAMAAFFFQLEIIDTKRERNEVGNR